MINRATLTLDNRLTGPEAVIAINAMTEFAASETAEIREALEGLLTEARRYWTQDGSIGTFLDAIAKAEAILTATKIVTDGADGVE